MTKNNCTTASGDYRLPSKVTARFKTLLLFLAPIVPSVVRRWYIKRHNYYQCTDVGVESSQGEPFKKLQALQLPDSMNGLSVLDIGCAEGFFARECADRGATRVIGVDANFASVLCATFLAKEEANHASFIVGAFPDSTMQESFDFVFCLAVLHHMVSTKDIWLVLSSEEHREDLSTLREHLRYLSARTAKGGTCIIEMPYEPQSVTSAEEVDFDVFCKELVLAGFRDATRVGSWEFSDACQGKKERQLYVARHS